MLAHAHTHPTQMQVQTPECVQQNTTSPSNSQTSVHSHTCIHKCQYTAPEEEVKQRDKTLCVLNLEQGARWEGVLGVLQRGDAEERNSAFVISQ